MNPPRFTDEQLLAIYHDPRPLRVIGAEMVPPLGQPRLSAMLKRLKLPTRSRVGKYPGRGRKGEAA